MLNSLENWLANAARLALPADVTLAIGPIVAPTGLPLLNVAASRLRPIGSQHDDNREPRQPAIRSRRFPLSSAGSVAEFLLPREIAAGDILEVEHAPGRLARPGDDYEIRRTARSKPDDSAGRAPLACENPGASQGAGCAAEWDETIVFYRPPPAGCALVVRDGQASGYRQVSACRVMIQLTAWAATAEMADALLAPLFASAFAAFAEVDRIELVRDERAGLVLRLLDPQADLAALERTVADGVSSSAPPPTRSSARLVVRGELETTVLLAEHPASATIECIDYTLNWSAGSGNSAGRTQFASTERRRLTDADV